MRSCSILEEELYIVPAPGKRPPPKKPPPPEKPPPPPPPNPPPPQPPKPPVHDPPTRTSATNPHGARRRARRRKIKSAMHPPQRHSVDSPGPPAASSSCTHPSWRRRWHRWRRRILRHSRPAERGASVSSRMSLQVASGKRSLEAITHFDAGLMVLDEDEEDGAVIEFLLTHAPFLGRPNREVLEGMGSGAAPERSSRSKFDWTFSFVEFSGACRPAARRRKPRPCWRRR